MSSQRSFAYASSASLTGTRHTELGTDCRDVPFWLGLFYTLVVALHIDALLERAVAFLCSFAAHIPAIQEWELVRALLEEQETLAFVRRVRHTSETFRLSVGYLLDPTQGKGGRQREASPRQSSSSTVLKSRPNLSSSTLGFDEGEHPDLDHCAAAQSPDKLFTPASVVVEESAGSPGEDEWGHFAYYDEDDDDFGDSSADQFQCLRQPLQRVDENFQDDGF